MKLKVWSSLFILMLLLAPSISWAVCSTVSIQIPQQLTLERIAFDAKMVITNNVPDKDLTNIRVDLNIKDTDGNDKSGLFYTRVVSATNVGAVDGTGTVAAATTGEIHWLIIPSPGAGGSDPAGVLYWVGATLTYTVGGNNETVSVNPDKITVEPQAQLILDYFMPYEVIGDNPFTSQVEPPQPFPLAVRVANVGYGTANKLKIDSAQPKIVDNKQGLLVDFRLLGASVNDSAVSPSLTVDIGTLASSQIATAYWEMISTLSGHFIGFDVTFSHASDLGGELTSIIKQTNAYYLVHRVRVNLPGRDNRLDFLADTVNSPDHLPNKIFESEIPNGSTNIDDSVSPVTVVAVTSAPSPPTPQQPNVTMQVATGDSGWVYARLPDPAMGLLKLQDVVRSDGVHLDPNNFWIAEGFDSNYQQTFTLNLLDYRMDGSAPGTYTLVYAQPVQDTIPPVTTLVYNGPYEGTNPVYITPDTKIIFTATDNPGGSGVASVLKKLVGADTDFVPAFPMSITNPGNAELDYYSIDRAGNKEVVRTTYFYVVSAAPNIVSFQAVPATFTPRAPAGVAATRSMNFTMTATSDISNLQSTIDIATGATFAEANIVKTIQTAVVSGVQASVSWDGKDKNGVLVPAGVYTARLRVTDGLDGGATSHTSSSDVTVTVSDWFKGNALDPNLSAAQMYPKVSGTKVVWQDQRNGNWNIYLKDVTGGSSTAITNTASDHMRPSISGNIIVWQDNRNGDWDIYGYDLSKGQEFVICNDPGNQEMPVISGDWVAWQDDRAGNWDIYAYNLSTQEKIQVTNHERDQMHPAISGNTLVWEDYRNGLGDVYEYDLISRIETRYTFGIYNKTFPAISGNTIAWTDQRNNQRDIYFSTPSTSEMRVTYGTGDHSQSAVSNNIIVYTDYETGANAPNLAFYDITTGAGEKLTTDTSGHEAPALDAGVLAWQDNRDGVFQIYWANFNIEELPIQAVIKPGFNLVAVGDRLAIRYSSASDLIAANPNGIGIQKVVTYDSLNGVFIESPPNDVALSKGMGIGLYASGGGVLDIGDSGETSSYTLMPGLNYIGMLTPPSGYTAYALLQSVGLDNIQSVRRFNNQTGLWETAAVRVTSSGKEAVGVNFVIRQGDGLIITMVNRVDQWKP